MKVRVYDSANLKRDKIIASARRERFVPEADANGAGPGSSPAGFEEALLRYEAYMEEHSKRRTPERSFILRKIYEQNVPVDIQTLHSIVCKEAGTVALTTVYNNLALLIDARLVRRLDLVGGAMAFFEKTLGVEPHGYMICQRCGKIRTLQVKSLTQEINPQLPKGFQITDINLQVNGYCKKCQTLIRKEAEQERKAAERTRKTISKAVSLALRKKKKKK